MTWTSYAGIEVKDFDSKVKCRHPRWGYDEDTLATLSGATLLSLADGIYVVVCNMCGYNGITGSKPYVKPEGEYKTILKQADSLMAHINGMHHPNKAKRRTSFYTDDQIKAAIKIWLKWRGTHIKNWTQSAIEELERLGFTPFRGEHWSAGALGSLVRSQMKKPAFKNIKAAPMDEAGQKAIEELVREAAEREGAGGGTTVATNVRITKKEKESPPHRHTPIDFSKIISDKKAAQKEQPQDQQEKEGTDVVRPTLSFAGAGSDAADPMPIKTLVVDTQTRERVVNESSKPALAQPIESDFKLVAELDDGTPLFTYRSDLMVGKKVKGVEI